MVWGYLLPILAFSSLSQGQQFTVENITTLLGNDSVSEDLSVDNRKEQEKELYNTIGIVGTVVGLVAFVMLVIGTVTLYRNSQRIKELRPSHPLVFTGARAKPNMTPREHHPRRASFNDLPPDLRNTFSNNSLHSLKLSSSEHETSSG